MKLKKLFKDLDVHIKGNRELEITGLSSHSQFVAPGNLFIAKRGRSHDGNAFVKEALCAGAQSLLTDLYNPFLSGSVQVIASDVEGLEPLLAQRYYQDPSRSLFLVGITGTNGKTTTAYLLEHLLSSSACPCGLIGTIESLVGGKRLPSELTTPDSLTIHKRLREMVDSGACSAVMEVTSHALDQNRVAHLDFDAAIFTNLSQDHLDYHGTMDHYRRAKKKLFAFVDTPKKLAIVNGDDPFFQEMFGTCNARRITCSIRGKGDVCAEEIETGLSGTCFHVRYRGQIFSVRSLLIGVFNVYNSLSAIALALDRGMGAVEICKKMETFPGVPGRLEQISNCRGIHLFVDFAHTEQALEQVLSTLGQIKTGRLITVFGCGGDRDRKKRPKMGRVVERFSDQMVITSDNPRSEDPRTITREIEEGFREKKPYLVEIDRRKGIERGIFMAQKGDIVLIAGRGHEPFQKVEGRLVPLDDRAVAFEIANSEQIR